MKMEFRQRDCILGKASINPSTYFYICSTMESRNLEKKKNSSMHNIP